MDGQTLKTYRLALGLTQRALGQAIGMSANQVARMERGERKILPRTLIAVRLLLQYRRSTIAG
jgi:transcriptional regulator with XRE-family HTH domain